MKFGRDAAGVAARQRTLACAHCGTPHLAMEFAVRPVGWERASATPPQGIVDDTTLQFSSVPWVVFRGDPRPEDIRQGSVGNCWFVCALSALAEKPETIRRILLTREFNRAGAYQVHLSQLSLLLPFYSLSVRSRAACCCALRLMRRCGSGQTPLPRSGLLSPPFPWSQVPGVRVYRWIQNWKHPSPFFWHRSSSSASGTQYLAPTCPLSLPPPFFLYRCAYV